MNTDAVYNKNDAFIRQLFMVLIGKLIIFSLILIKHFDTFITFYFNFIISRKIVL